MEDELEPGHAKRRQVMDQLQRQVSHVQRQLGNVEPSREPGACRRVGVGVGGERRTQCLPTPSLEGASERARGCTGRPPGARPSVGAAKVEASPEGAKRCEAAAHEESARGGDRQKRLPAVLLRKETR